MTVGLQLDKKSKGYIDLLIWFSVSPTMLTMSIGGKLPARGEIKYKSKTTAIKLYLNVTL